jgi:ribosomal protein S18 acetylase RimI-like enzyme
MRVRGLRRSDLAAVGRIEKAITGKRAGLEKDIARLLRQGGTVCLVAEEGGGVAGFIVGDVRPWEFGETSEVGWVRAVGVDPEFQGQGVGRALGNALLRRFRARGVRTVRTLVEWHAGDVIAYFKDLGFDRSRHVALEKTLR